MNLITLKDNSLGDHPDMVEPKIIKLKNIINEDAGLVIAQNDRELPFEVKRVYWFYGVPEGQVRGHHAHKENQKVLICTQGLVEVLLEHSTGYQYKFKLNKPYIGLYIPPLYWGTYKFKNNATMISLASELYDEDDYIRDYEVFKRL